MGAKRSRQATIGGRGWSGSAGGHSRLDPAEGDASRRGSLEVVFDTLSVARSLTAAGIEPAHADAITSSQTPPYRRFVVLEAEA